MSTRTQSDQQFVSYEISPVYLTGPQPSDTITPSETWEEACAGARAANTGSPWWTLYGRTPAGPVEFIGDFPTYQQAAAWYALLTGLSAPIDPKRHRVLPIKSEAGRVGA